MKKETSVKKICGRKAGEGIAEGRLFVLNRGKSEIRRDTGDARSELSRYETARDSVASELDSIGQRAKKELGEDGAMIFEIHRMMLYDDDFDKAVMSEIEEKGVNAEWAVSNVAESLARVFSDMDGEYMKARAADVRDVARRLIDSLSGRDGSLELSFPAIIAADDLTPGETVSLKREYALGFITEGGSESSHSAILARTMGIPAVVAAGRIDSGLDGKYCVLDGFDGVLYVEPDEDTKNKLLDKGREHEEHKKRLERLRGLLAKTKDGKRIRVYANIGDISDVEYAVRADAEGIGLFRSEFLYMRYGRLPTEDEQFEVYKAAGEYMGGKELIVRTLDAGADKKIDYLGLQREANPAMGLRAIRLCMERTELFLSQLRALYRAAAHTDISIMFPMIVCEDEIIRAKELCALAREQLKAEGLSFNDDTKIGIMIETPAAAICADELARHVDFFSIGTNDLTQYTAAADRENPSVSYLSDKSKKAVLRLVAYVARCAVEAGIWAGVCGELAGDEKLTEFFVSAGITELSVTPSRILAVREAVMDSSAGRDITAYLGNKTPTLLV